MKKGAIVIPAYNRPESLSRLLASVEASDAADSVPIVISLDGGFLQSVASTADQFLRTSRFVNVEVLKHPQNLGLREHILKCGDLTDSYDFIVLLEDDLYVAADFYQFSLDALEFYEGDGSISGISLYSPCISEISSLPFNPVANGASAYFMQVPCSWGQVWNKAQWSNFRNWYGQNKNISLDQIALLPQQVANWPKSSWKKYFYAYNVLNDLFFIYPYQTKTTNFSDTGGVHLKVGTDILQTNFPLLQSMPRYSFLTLQIDAVKYDGFFEISPSTLGLSNDYCVNLDGQKPPALIEKYANVISCVPSPNAFKSFGLRMRPAPLNILHNIPGKDIYICPVEGSSSSKLTMRYLKYVMGFDPFTLKLGPKLLAILVDKIMKKILY